MSLMVLHNYYRLQRKQVITADYSTILKFDVILDKVVLIVLLLVSIILNFLFQEPYSCM